MQHKSSHLPTQSIVSRSLKIRRGTWETPETATSNDNSKTDLWTLILTNVEARFELALKGDTKRDRKSLVDVSWVRARISEAVGVVWQRNALNTSLRSFRDKDFVCLRSLNKELSLVSRGNASALLRQAVCLLEGRDLNGENSAQLNTCLHVPAPTNVEVASTQKSSRNTRKAVQLLATSIEQYNVSLEVRPSDVAALVGRAVALSHQALSTAFTR